jgi:hypothetical protein
MIFKRIFISTLAVSFVLSFVSMAQAINIGGAITRTATETGKGVARGSVQSEYNKKLAKQKCKFEGDSTTQFTDCDVDKIISEMNALRISAESSGFANDVDIIIKTHGSTWDIARQRAEYLRDKVRAQVSGSWDYNVKYTKAPSNDVYFQVQIR